MQQDAADRIIMRTQRVAIPMQTFILAREGFRAVPMSLNLERLIRALDSLAADARAATNEIACIQISALAAEPLLSRVDTMLNGHSVNGNHAHFTGPLETAQQLRAILTR